jgi:hypothetical protein
MLTLSMLQSFFFSSQPQAPKGGRDRICWDDIPAGDSAEIAGTDPSTTSAAGVTIAMVGTSPGHLAPSAGVTPPLVMSTVVVKPRVLRLKKPAMKKSSL